MNYEKKAQELIELMPDFRASHTSKHVDEMSKGEGMMLFTLEHNGGKMMPGEIAKEICVSTARVAVILNVAEKKGFIKREAIKGDRRKTNVVLTAAGKKKVKDNYTGMIKRISGFLELLGDEDTEEFIRLMQKISKISKEQNRKGE